MANATTTCTKTKWKGRPAMRMANGAIELTALTGGGAIADLRLSTGSSEVRQNVLWEAPWASLDPDRYQPHLHNPSYGPAFVGKFLAGFTGHALCLDYFGAPSEAEAKEGLCLHGEAPVSRWKVLRQTQSKASASLLTEVQLPGAGLKFHRELHMRRGETVVYVSETVFNLRPTDHFFHWVQHVTLGGALLKAGESQIFLPAHRGVTWPHGYEGKSLLANSKEFSWPHAPAEDGRLVDISLPFSQPGKGFVASILLNSGREWSFVAALNFRLGLVLGYCFPRAAFPWVALWEENCARQDPPWRGKTQALGVEFGTTPMPIGRRAAFEAGPLFGMPTSRTIPAKGKLQTNYVIFVAPVNRGWREIVDVDLGKRAITVVGTNHGSMDLPAQDLGRMSAS